MVSNDQQQTKFLKDMAMLRQLLEQRMAEASRGEVSKKSITEVLEEVIQSRHI